jgi:GntR family transcriptional regulator
MTHMSRGRVRPDGVLSLPATLLPDRPKGDQLRAVLVGLATGLGPGQPIPSERFLAEHFQIARSTVRLVISRLVADGVLYRQHGNATFTAESPTMLDSTITSFTADIRARGLVPSAVVLAHSVNEAGAELAAYLELPPGALVFRLDRLRLVNDEPLAIERTNLPLERFAGIELLDWQDRSLHQTLWDRWRVHPERNESSITAMLPDPAEAALLNVSAAQPCLKIRSQVRATDNLVIEAGCSVYRADRHSVFARFRTSAP